MQFCCYNIPQEFTVWLISFIEGICHCDKWIVKVFKFEESGRLSERKVFVESQRVKWALYRLHSSKFEHFTHMLIW